MFAHQYKKDFVKDKPEVNSGKNLTEKAGYIPAKQRIENMILAGQRLSDYRKEQYDFHDSQIDENFIDPTRSPNFDLADASQLQLIAEQNIINAQRAFEAQQKASQTAQEPQKGASEQENVPE